MFIHCINEYQKRESKHRKQTLNPTFDYDNNTQFRDIESEV